MTGADSGWEKQASLQRVVREWMWSELFDGEVSADELANHAFDYFTGFFEFTEKTPGWLYALASNTRSEWMNTYLRPGRVRL